MSDLHDLCKFPSRPVNQEYIKNLRYYLSNGIPATYTVEEAYNFTNNIEEDALTTTTPLHLIATHVPIDCDAQEKEVVDTMVQTLLEYGAGWCLTDINNDTPGCILLKRDLAKWNIYQLIVDAGVRAELLLRKVGEYDVEFIEEGEVQEVPELVNEKVNEEVKESVNEGVSEGTNDTNMKLPTLLKEIDDAPDAPSLNQNAYLNTPLEYTEDSLITKDRHDGVMMSWETGLMQLGCDSLFEGAKITSDEIDSEVVILNIGFGMGIIDTMIALKKPTKHYICEAHPDVLRKLHDDGWYEKPNVVILEGRWQEQLDTLLSQGNVFFNGIYYDTFSEHYLDMLELFDYVVGLLKPHGVFSFFNGLGADREVIYDVYKKLVEIDLGNYGLQCKFTSVDVPASTLHINQDSNEKSVWDDVKRSYWSCPVYYHPEARFIDI